jgi:hypothetical protein
MWQKMCLKLSKPLATCVFTFRKNISHFIQENFNGDVYVEVCNMPVELRAKRCCEDIRVL